MSSKAHRLKVRAQRRRNHARSAAPLDPHAEVVLSSFASTLDAIGRFAASDDPVADINAALAGLVERLAARLRRVDPARVIEVARMACLPWSSDEHPPAGAQSGPTQAELITLIAVSAAQQGVGQEDLEDKGQPQDESLKEAGTGSTRPENKQEAEPERVIAVVNEAVPLIDQILELGQVREMARADHQDPLAMVTASVRASQVWIRNTSYPDMVSRTLSRPLRPTGHIRRSPVGPGIRGPGRPSCAGQLSCLAGGATQRQDASHGRSCARRLYVRAGRQHGRGHSCWRPAHLG